MLNYLKINIVYKKTERLCLISLNAKDTLPCFIIIVVCKFGSVFRQHRSHVPTAGVDLRTRSLHWLFKVISFSNLVYLQNRMQASPKKKKKKPLQGCVLDIFYGYEGCSTAGTGNTIADAATFIKIDMNH